MALAKINELQQVALLLYRDGRIRASYPAQGEWFEEIEFVKQRKRIRVFGPGKELDGRVVVYAEGKSRWTK